jgi:hypothetical protein
MRATFFIGTVMRRGRPQDDGIRALLDDLA